MTRVLGLDVGPNSIGWALLDESNRQLVGLGVRVFPEGVDNFDTAKEVSRNEQRRIARSMRRQTARRRRRQQNLEDALTAAGLLPDTPDELIELKTADPYELRAKALDEKLTLHKLGRVFLHLSQRRGYLSNSKRDTQKTEGKIVLSEINVTASQIAAAECRTLGEFLHKRHETFDHTRQEMEDILPDIKKTEFKDKGRVRNRHLHRSMYEEEFAAIWDKQMEFHPDVLTETLRYGAAGKQKYPRKPVDRRRGEPLLEKFGIHGLIFFHRALKPIPANIIGLCELEPKQKRCPRADRHAQRFRMLQEVNNLRYIDPDSHEERALDDGQRAVLLSHMATRDRVTFDTIRKKLGFLESVRFNLERGKRTSIKGSETDVLMTKAVGKQWYERPENERDDIVRMLLSDVRDDDLVAETLREEHKFTGDQAEAALTVDFPKGYSHVSLKAIDKLLPHMERGLVYQAEDETNSAIHAAGYVRRDELQRRIFDTLPDPSRTSTARIGDIPNSVVKRALVELRKVVNAIIREYGRPDAVHVEMARSVRLGPSARSDYNTRIREREERRDAAKKALRTRGIGFGAGGRNIHRVLLWEEQAHECVYCGKGISQDQLFGGEVDVDHILPYSRCLDDSQMNKVVCHRHCNHDKGQKTPYEWKAESEPEEYERICQHAGSLMRRGLMPYGKYRRFLQKELKLDDFIARQLVDTGYIARATAEYLRCLFENDHDVLGLKGALTAELRHHWGLNTVLSELPDSPAWQAQSDMRPGEKNRADHRHHAIDAIVCALTDRSRLQKLSRISKQGGMHETGEVLDDPWDGFRNDVVNGVKGINVSHRVRRKVRGGLHEDTFYGPTESPEHWVSRKPVDALSPNEIEKIRDAGIRRIIIDRLREHGVEYGRGVKVDSKTWRQVLTDLRMPSGVPIKKVRVVKPEKTIQPIRSETGDAAYVRPGFNHHAALFQLRSNGKPKWDAEYCTGIEVVRRALDREPIVSQHHSQQPDATFLMSLCTGDMVLADVDGEKRLMVVSTLVSTQKRIHLVEATDARRSSDKKDFGLTPSSLIGKYNARKVTVDPLGRIRWAND